MAKIKNSTLEVTAAAVPFAAEQILFSLDRDGVIDSAANAKFTAPASNKTPLILKGASGQSSKLLDIQNNSGTTLFSVDKSGYLSSGGLSVLSGGGVSLTGLGTGLSTHATHGIYLNPEDAGYATIKLVGTAGRGTIDFTGPNVNFNGRFQYESTVHAFEFYTGANSSPRVRIDRSEDALGAYGTLWVNPAADDRRGVVIKAAASQTANLLEVQNNSGTVLATIKNSGEIQTSIVAANNSISISGSNGSGKGIFIVPQVAVGGYNPSSSAGEQALIFTGGSINTGSLIIAPHSSSSSGIKINTSTVTIPNGSITLGNTNITSNTALAAKNLTMGGVTISDDSNSDYTAIASTNQLTLSSSSVSISSEGYIFLYHGTATQPTDSAAVRIPYITSGSGTTLVINGNYSVQKSSSSIRYKTNVEDIEQKYIDNVLNLRPVWYKSNPQTTSQEQNFDWSWFGLIAEEVAEIEPRLVNYSYLPEDYVEGTHDLKPNAKLKPESVSYDRIPVLLIGIIKKQKEQIQSLEDRIKALEDILLNK